MATHPTIHLKINIFVQNTRKFWSMYAILTRGRFYHFSDLNHFCAQISYVSIS